jgi:chromosomal replication initiator protein
MSAANAQALWERIRKGLLDRLSDASFREWIDPCEALECEENRLTVRVASAAAKLWIEQQLAEEFHDALVQAGLEELELLFQLGNAAPVAVSRPSKREGSVVESPLGGSSAFPTLFHRYTLDRFVVGPGSQLAFAAARAVVDSRGRGNNGAISMNPFFIYGGAGLGKTHLMIGIGKGMEEHMPGLKVAYLKVDAFFHEVTTAIAKRDTQPLRSKYQQNDLLLLDDVQALGKMERTQEEIFYILEYLLQHGKQIVITSDKPPEKLEGLHDRLKTRFKWGLTADIQPPDFETRVAILTKKLEEPDFADLPPVPPDVITFIAHKAKGSVRDLEGLLNRVIFQASFLGVPVSLEVAHAAFQGQTGDEATASIPIERIYRMTAETFSVPFQDLMKKKSRQQSILLPRQVAMYLARELAAASYPAIGKSFDMHYSTVMNAIDSVRERMRKDPDFHKKVESLLNSIH